MKHVEPTRKNLRKQLIGPQGVTSNLLERFDGFAEPVLKVVPSLGLFSRAVATSPGPPLKSCQVSVSQSAFEAQAGVVL